MSGGTWQRTFKIFILIIYYQCFFNSTITIDIEEREEREQMCLPKEAVVSFKIFFVLPSKSLAVMKLIIHLMAMHIRGP